MASHYRINDDVLDRLASGSASPPELELLRSGQLSKHLQLVTFLYGSLTAQGISWRPAIDLLSSVQQTAPEVAQSLLTAPCFGSWASVCARRALSRTDSGLPLAVDASYLEAVAVVAALRAGLDTSMTLFVRDGMVFLPTLGLARVAAPELSPVVVTVTSATVTLRGTTQTVCLPEDLDTETESWLPTRKLRLTAEGVTIELSLEDGDPFRDCYGYVISPRLTAAEVAQWSAAFHDAWQVIASQNDGRAYELSLGLRSIVPLAPNHPGPDLSATSATAYGALAMTLPRQPEHLAATLVHEFQHSKLSALLDLVPLYDTSAQARHFAPWRAEPRPIGGLLHGCYAFLAVSGFWQRLYQSAQGAPAHEQLFAELRLQVNEVLTTLERGPHLTGDGRAFVGKMRGELDRQLAVAVSSEVADTARRNLDSNRKSWQRRHPEAVIG